MGLHVLQSVHASLSAVSCLFTFVTLCRNIAQWKELGLDVDFAKSFLAPSVIGIQKAVGENERDQAREG